MEHRFVYNAQDGDFTRFDQVSEPTAWQCPRVYSGDAYHTSREKGQNPRRKADGMAMPPSFTRWMLTIRIESRVETVGLER